MSLSLSSLAHYGSEPNGNGGRFHFLCVICRWSRPPLGTALILTNVWWVAVLISFRAHYSPTHTQRLLMGQR